jgi:hypothetical protein
VDRVVAPARVAPKTAADRSLVAMIERTTPKLLARYDNELDLRIAANEATEESEMLGQPDPPVPYVTDTPAAQAALRDRADQLVQRARAVRIARLRATRQGPPAGSQRIRGSLRSGRPRTSRRVRARGPSSDDPDPASDEPARPAAEREVALSGGRR